MEVGESDRKLSSFAARARSPGRRVLDYAASKGAIIT